MEAKFDSDSSDYKSSDFDSNNDDEEDESSPKKKNTNKKKKPPMIKADVEERNLGIKQPVKYFNDHPTKVIAFDLETYRAEGGSQIVVQFGCMDGDGNPFFGCLQEKDSPEAFDERHSTYKTSAFNKDNGYDSSKSMSAAELCEFIVDRLTMYETIVTYNGSIADLHWINSFLKEYVRRIYSRSS